MRIPAHRQGLPRSIIHLGGRDARCTVPNYNTDIHAHTALSGGILCQSLLLWCLRSNMRWKFGRRVGNWRPFRVGERSMMEKESRNTMKFLSSAQICHTHNECIYTSHQHPTRDMFFMDPSGQFLFHKIADIDQQRLRAVQSSPNYLLPVHVAAQNENIRIHVKVISSHTAT